MCVLRKSFDHSDIGEREREGKENMCLNLHDLGFADESIRT